MDTVFRLALHYTKSRSESDDITQEVLLKLYRTDKPFESEDHVRYWLIRVTVNECKRAFLSPWKRTEPIEDYAEQLLHSPTVSNTIFIAKFLINRGITLRMGMRSLFTLVAMRALIFLRVTSSPMR